LMEVHTRQHQMPAYPTFPATPTPGQPGQPGQHPHTKKHHIRGQRPFRHFGEGNIPTRWCDTCYIDESPFDKVTGEAEAVGDRKEWAKDTEKKAFDILNMLSELNPSGQTDAEKATTARIAEEKNLLRLYYMIKNKAQEVMIRSGIEVQLPSSQATLVDASGKHWENAEMKDSLEQLKIKWDKMVKANMDALKREEERADVQQFHNPLALTAKIVGTLPRIEGECPCECESTKCPCDCPNEEAKVTTVDSLSQKVEADIDACNTNSACE